MNDRQISLVQAIPDNITSGSIVDEQINLVQVSPDNATACSTNNKQISLVQATHSKEQLKNQI